MKRKHLVFSLLLLVSPISVVIFYTTSLLSPSIKSINKTIILTLNLKEQISTSKNKSEPIKYLKLLSCQNSYNEWPKDKNTKSYNISAPADKKLHEKRFIRAIIVYFPISDIDYYKDEFKWLYRSWINMMKYEPVKWRTDLVVFVDNDPALVNNGELSFMNEMNCRFENIRKSSEETPMCSLINYVPLNKREFDTPERTFANDDQKYRYLLNDVDIFKSSDPNEFDTFYKLLKLSINDYNYLDSILMAFEGYEYFKSAGYDFIVRSDMDVFLTPLFSTWLPRHCNDFNVGRGGYSTDFNVKRFARIANNLGLKYAGEQNMGSTWYSTPAQFRLVAYLTLFSMAYLAKEEFTPAERAGQLDTLLWPDWHYQVVLLYGQTLALNHLIAGRQINVVKLQNLLDYPSGNGNSIHRVIHIHVYHDDVLFSKFAFKSGLYDQMNVTDSKEIRFYCLKMALDAKRKSETELFNMFIEESKRKV